MSKKKLNFAFFGSSKFSLDILKVLKKNKFTPSLVVTTPDRPAGRGQTIAPTPVKVWAEENSVPTFQPLDYKEDSINKLKSLNPKRTEEWDFFIVASYGSILPEKVISMPNFKSLNVHPSLLPKLRGSSPIESAILREKETGVTIMRMDERMDHGPILTQKKVFYKNWPPDAPTLEKDLAKEGALLSIKTIPLWINGEIEEKPQNEKEATYTTMIKKSDALLDIENEKPEFLYSKIKAYKDRFKPYFFISTPENKQMRIIVTEAELSNGKLLIKRVVPEGKKETDYQEFMQKINRG